MSGLGTCMLASVMMVGAPIPPEPPQDPLGRGYMGIRVQSGTLVIESVEPNLPAFKAGLKPRDVIVRVGTLEPQLFEQVIAHICSFRPGAIVEIEVQRGTEKKTFKVQLATRPLELDHYPIPNEPPPR